jgi:hypothetical protein
MGLLVDEPIIVKMMLDCRAYIILINDVLVCFLGFCQFLLHKPLPISVTLNNATSSSNSHLHEYVKIAPFAPDSSYVSCMIKAIIMLKLCVPLLLGLPFLSANHIIADFFAYTTIDQTCGYDLLNAPIITKKKLIEPVMSCLEVKRNKQTMLWELVLVYKDHLKMEKGVSEKVVPLNVAAMVKKRIEVLVMQEKFSILERDFLAKFKDGFEPLPHVNKLPQNVTTRIS